MIRKRPASSRLLAPPRLRASAFLLCLSFLSVPLRALAQDPPPADPPRQALDPAKVRGIERPALQKGDAGREAAAGVLFVPRELVKLVFLASGLTAGLIRDEEVVPRMEELLSPRPGSYSVLPMLFLDSRRKPGAGAQLLGTSRYTAMRLAFGFGGIHDLVGEARVAFAMPRPLPFVITLEGLADSRSTLDYVGVGQDPDSDPRNHFLATAATHDALYFEERQRAILSVGVRAGPNIEAFLSSSLLRSSVTDTPGGGPQTITQVFEAGSVPGAPALVHGGCPRRPSITPFTLQPCPTESRISYSEVAVRFDTRRSKSRPSPGVLVETYGGISKGIGDDPTYFYRLGGRAAGFISLRRLTNILSPKIVVDGTVQPSGAPPVPFTQLVGQPDFRGMDSRVDSLSVVYSLDYRWSLVRYLGPRLFVDMAQVGPDMLTLLKGRPRLAGGFGIDLFSDSTELAQTMISFSGEGVRFLLSFGVPTQFGDRQHRR